MTQPVSGELSGMRKGKTKNGKNRRWEERNNRLFICSVNRKAQEMKQRKKWAEATQQKLKNRTVLHRRAKYYRPCM